MEQPALVLVRHGAAGDKHAWRGDDVLRPLTRRGRAQAGSVADLLTGLGVHRLLSSPALRCTQTLAPTAERLGSAVEVHPALAVGAPLGDLLGLLSDAGTRGAALCTHGEVLTSLARAWDGAFAPTPDGEPDDLARTPKGAVWVVERLGPPVRARFTPPQPSGGE